MSHVPVMLNEVIEYLDPKDGKFVIDGTTNGGGHAQEIISKLENGGIFLGTDWDKGMVDKLKKKLLTSDKTKKIILKHSNYADIPEIIKKEKLPKVDGLLLDLGFSSAQLEEEQRGFSFLKDEVLDMRYDKESGETAAEFINKADEKELADIIYKYGEERFSRRIAKVIVEERKKKKIITTNDLVEAIKKSVPVKYERGRIHPATRVFQALRIYINKELDNLENILKKSPEIFSHNGRLTIISFHSLEDRIVKNYFKELEKNKLGKILTKKPITATEEEIKQNPRSRSAKLRAFQFN